MQHAVFWLSTCSTLKMKWHEYWSLQSMYFLHF